MPKRGRFLRVLWIAISLVVLLAWCAASLARAGGGHGYGGGGGGHGGGGFGGGGGHGGGGGGGGADLGPLFYWLFVLHPGAGFPLLIIVIAFFIISAKQGNGMYQSGVIRRGSDIMDLEARRAMIAAMVQRDPGFSESEFLQRIAVAFQKTQDAWSAQQMEMARAFVSDGVFERFNLQIDEQKTLGFRNLMQNVVVQNAEIAQVFSDAHFDEISVLIEASATDTDVSPDTGETLRTNETGPFVEIWSFIRRRGAMTRPDRPGLIEGNCPNCGAPIEMNQNANCAHCKTLLRSGEYDWVLAEITQECEWRLQQQRNLPGVAQIIERDPEFNTQELEDRASVMFWRRAACERLGNSGPLRSVASREFCELYESQLRAQPDEGRTYFGECAVGSVDTMGVIQGVDIDRVLVEVRWSGRRFVMQNGQPRRGEETMLNRSVLVLARKPGVKTDVEKAISSAHCPNCGAPNTTLGVSGACEFCGAILNDGSRGWVLWDIQSPAAAGNMLRQLSPPPIPNANGMVSGAPAPAGLLSWMVLTAMADGTVTSKEMEVLTHFADRQNVPRERVEEMIRAALRNQLSAPEPSDPREARAWLTAMIEAALADGTFSTPEYELIRATGERVGMVDYEIRLLVNSVRGRMYNQAKEALRNNGGHL